MLRIIKAIFANLIREWAIWQRHWQHSIKRHFYWFFAARCGIYQRNCLPMHKWNCDRWTFFGALCFVLLRINLLTFLLSIHRCFRCNLDMNVIQTLRVRPLELCLLEIRWKRNQNIWNNSKEPKWKGSDSKKLKISWHKKNNSEQSRATWFRFNAHFFVSFHPSFVYHSNVKLCE